VTAEGLGRINVTYKGMMRYGVPLCRNQMFLKIVSAHVKQQAGTNA
jgi:hypothetical protein